MTNEDITKAEKILERAKSARKGDYSIYNSFKTELGYITMDSVEYSSYCRRLANILKV